MFRSIKLGTLLKTEIKLHWTWFLLLIIWVDFDTAEKIMWDVLTLVCVFGVVLIHEFGHITAARRYGVDTPKVTLSLLGGAAHIGKEMDGLKPMQQIWVVFAGPLTNIVLAILLLPICIYSLQGVDLEAENAIKALSGNQLLIFTVFAINIVMFVFNMLPIYPMDGGRILRSVLQHFKVKMALFISIRTTQVVTLLLLAWCISVGAIVGAIIAILFFVMAWYEVRSLKKEIVEHELAKAVAEAFDGNMPQAEILDQKVSEVQAKVRNGKLWRETDYTQKHVTYGHKSEEDS
jgi:Zn-dependent protease